MTTMKIPMLVALIVRRNSSAADRWRGAYNPKAWKTPPHAIGPRAMTRRYPRGRLRDPYRMR
jgi:hypothetical protein